MYITRKAGTKILKYKTNKKGGTKMKAKKAVSLFMTAVLTAAALTGCGGGRGTEETAQTADAPAAAAETPEAGSGEEAEPAETGEEAGTPSAGGGVVGVALPWLGTQNWAEAEVMFEEQLEAAGYMWHMLVMKRSFRPLTRKFRSSSNRLSL